MIFGCFVQEGNSHIRADCVLARHSRQSSALASDCDIKRLVALRSQLVESDVFAHVDSRLELDSEFTQHVDFRFDDVLFEFVGRNAISEHTAKALVLFEHGGFVSLRGEIIRAAESRGACADDGNLLAPLFVNVGRNDDFGNISRFRVQILLCDELLDVVDCDGFVYRSARASRFATLVADASANRREGIVFLDERKSVAVFAFFCLAYVALNRNVRGACDLARRRTRFIAVDAVFISVIFVPFVGAPAEIVGKLVFGIFDFALLGAKFLSEFDCACGAGFHAFATSDAFVFFNSCDVGASGHVGSVEKLRRAQCIADVDVAVADCKNLVFAVDVCDLMHETVLFRVAQNLHCLVVGYIATFARFTAVVRHIADADAPFFTAVAATFAELGSAVATRTDAHAEMSFVFFEPIGNVLDVHRAVFHFDCFLDGNDVHTDSRASRRNHRSDHRQGKIGHSLKEHRKFGMVVKLLLYHIGKLRGTRNEHRKNVAAHGLCSLDGTIVIVVVAVIVFQNADVAHFFHQLVKLFFIHIGMQCFKVFHRVMLAHLHFESDVRHFVSHDACKSPVFGVVCRDAKKLVIDAIRDFSRKFENLLSGIGIAHILRDIRFAHLSHINFLL